MVDMSSTITIEHIPPSLLGIFRMEPTMSSVKSRFMVAPHQDISVRTVLYRVHKIVRKVTVTSWMERVLGVLMDTKVEIVIYNAKADRTVKSVIRFVETVKTMNHAIT